MFIWIIRHLQKNIFSNLTNGLYILLDLIMHALTKKNKQCKIPLCYYIGKAWERSINYVQLITFSSCYRLFPLMMTD